MIRLSVNVNKIATLRNSRGATIPRVVDFAVAALEAGADGITVHPRPDERHIRLHDVRELRPIVKAPAEFNIEGYPDARYHEIIRTSRPEQATLVPDPPTVLTSSSGWDAVSHQVFLRETIAELKEHTERVSVFIDPDEAQVEAARAAGADRIEFYTEPFASAFAQGRGQESFAIYERAARRALDVGLGINAGHDLNLDNLVLLRELPGLDEVSIGHALVNDALWMGWKPTVQAYLKVLRGAR